MLEYPVYSTAYGLRVLVEAGAPGDSALVRRMAAYLRAQQFTEARGIAPGHPAYGAWGFGETNLGPGQTGHLDLSHTRRALGALRAADALDAASAEAATRFLRLVQKHPGEPRPQPPDGVRPDSASETAAMSARRRGTISSSQSDDMTSRRHRSDSRINMSPARAVNRPSRSLTSHSPDRMNFTSTRSSAHFGSTTAFAP